MKSLLIALLATLFTITAYFPAEAEGTQALYKVITSTRTIERGHIIGPEDVRSSSVSRLDRRAVTDINAVLGKTLKRTIGKNTTIKSSYLRVGPRVRRGDDIIIVARGNGIKVTVQGRARESADIGEMIELDNLASGKVIFGRLVNSNTALVSF